jgi:GT2 family glycosyltransferase
MPEAIGGRRALDIVIPARDEAATLGVTLGALLADGDGLGLHVVLALNGEGVEDMRSVARSFEESFRAKGHRLTVLSTGEAGKAAALNLADRHRDPPHPVVYLDADCFLFPGSLGAISGALADHAPRLAAPPMSLLAPRSFLARRYMEVWKRLPAISCGIVGAGCFGVNPAGRARWDAFPNDLPDDAFVLGLFRPEERIVASEGGFLFVFPDGAALVGADIRWKAGNRALRRRGRCGDRAAPADASPAAQLLWLIRTPSIWRRVPAFLAVKATASITARRRPRAADFVCWRPRRPPAPTAVALPLRDRPPRVAAIVVTHNNEADVTRCLRSLHSRWSELSLVVIDNASTDGTRAELAAMPGLSPVLSEANLGFARAVNAAAARCMDADYLLLVNPDVVLEDHSIDALLALALRFPDAGLYGGRMIDATGRLDPTSCLSLPSLRTAALFASGAALLQGWPVFDPDSLGGWPRDDTREVPVLTGGFLLIEARLWRHLGGFDGRFFLYGEDVDFCMRARTFGARPLMTNLCRYMHRGGGSSPYPAERMVRIMRGKANLHISRRCGGIQVGLLVLGAGLRALLERSLVSRRRVWREVWRRRREWASASSASPQLPTITISAREA